MQGEGQEGQHAPLPSVPSYTTPSPSLQCASPCPPASTFAHMPGRHKGQCLSPSHAQAVPSTWAAPLPCAPPLLYVPPCPHTIHPFCVHARSTGGMGCVQWEGHAEGATCKGATCQGKAAHKGSACKGARRQGKAACEGATNQGRTACQGTTCYVTTER